MTAQLIGNYLEYCRALKMSAQTISNYERGLRFFGAYLDQQGKTLPLAQSADVNGYIAAHPEWTAATTANRLSALRGFYKWMQIQRLLPDVDPMLEVRAPRQRLTRNKPSVSREEALLLTAARHTRRDGIAFATDLRNRCLMSLIYDTGLRVSEAASLNLGTIRRMDPRRREFIFTGKGGSEYFGYLSPDAYAMLSAYADAQADAPDSRALFVNRGGERLSVRSIQKLIAASGKRVLNRRLHPHMLRRGFGNAFYEASGHDIYATSQAMHHASVTTTEEYLAVSPEHLKKVVDRMSAKPGGSRSM